MLITKEELLDTQYEQSSWNREVFISKTISILRLPKYNRISIMERIDNFKVIIRYNGKCEDYKALQVILNLLEL